MHRIKSVKAVFYNLIMRPLFAIVQPNGDQRQTGNPLLYNINFSAKDFNREGKTADHFPVDVEQADCLGCKAPPFPLTEQVKDHDHQDTVAEVIHK